MFRPRCVTVLTGMLLLSAGIANGQSCSSAAVYRRGISQKYQWAVIENVSNSLRKHFVFPEETDRIINYLVVKQPGQQEGPCRCSHA